MWQHCEEANNPFEWQEGTAARTIEALLSSGTTSGPRWQLMLR
jgi:hypothetical protein